MSMKEEIIELAKRTKEASRMIANLSREVKDKALNQMADALMEDENRARIKQANQLDLKAGKEAGLSTALMDRLLLTDDRIADMAEGLREVAALPDPVGEITGMWRRPNGLEIGRMRVPLGVVGIIYEARPNVTADAAGLCLKSGNAILLRGGKEAINSNRAIAKVLAEAGAKAGLPEHGISIIETTDRAAVAEMLKLDEYIDVIIPRGSQPMIKSILEMSRVPVISHGAGNCHTFVDESADLEKAVKIAINAKVQRPGVCNAMETLLVHSRIANTFLPEASGHLMKAGVELRGCSRTREILPEIKAATEEDYETEYLDLILAVRIVDSLDEAIEHITLYGTGHSEAIVTESYQNARRFLREVDASSVFVNASTRLADGHQYGLGAEIGISTQKLHARGPMGLAELTSTKFIVLGEGQIRN
ncbi:MAG: glutamate-5-semialdehyde dehydrogenase [bacterium]